ncbi:sra-4 [Pristionchus pacificus]|uniref:G protein-coupled receptor n=1 Tax=Pristionchus pacificus TaxID=54126 RepID=A0A2A6C5W2_PRIPA|nr:sra-4 [Pristionchus pacificus]|eukprot:PDM73602.1 G protein-coupled receptor [Pristionchus pacificus]
MIEDGSSMTDTPCSVVAEYNEHAPLHVAQYIQISFSLISLVIVVYTATHFLFKTIFETIFKGCEKGRRSGTGESGCHQKVDMEIQEILLTLYVFIFLHSLLTIILQGALVYVRIFRSDPCQAQISKLLCYTLRIILRVCMSIFVCINLSITCQRIVTTFIDSRLVHKISGRSMIVMSLLYSLMITWVAYRNDSYTGRVPYCTGSSADSQDVNTYNMSVLFAFDVLTIMIDLALLKYNYYQINHEKSFSLSITFRRRQNVVSIQQFLPSLVFHTMCYVVQLGGFFVVWSIRDHYSSVEFASINAFIYCMPFYCAIGPAILLYLMRQGRLIRKEKLKTVVEKKTTHTKTYFESLHQQWETVTISIHH